MRRLLLPLALFAPLPAVAQATTTQKLPPANPLPYEDDDAAAVLAPINALLASFAVGDAEAMLRVVYPHGRTTGVGPLAAGQASQVRHLSWAEYSRTIRPEDVFVEKITTPAIEVDGDIAMVWAPYTVSVAGKVTNCGINHFDLVRENGTWKVLNTTYTMRYTGCPGQ
ncbi:nuclear transport factor 2 family protein [Sphingomonas soli]|uniref:nuclear transport factor 2 family protein n=1 Tax=Sphingomonas soli TaxID=266127 RepID=UPI000837635A|nr:nuclear transport factor 2 family protein [Sphingomonas soli]